MILGYRELDGICARQSSSEMVRREEPLGPNEVLVFLVYCYLTLVGLGQNFLYNPIVLEYPWLVKLIADFCESGLGSSASSNSACPDTSS